MGRLAHNKSMRVTYHHDERVDVAGTGFTVLDRVYADGGFAGEALGGSCGNVLVSLAMLHRHVAPLLALGMDNTGERLVSELSQAGANTDRKSVVSGKMVSVRVDVGGRGIYKKKT